MTTVGRLPPDVPNTTENDSCHRDSLPTNQIRDISKDNIPTFLYDVTEDPDTDDALLMLEAANLKCLLSEEISFVSARRNVYEDKERELNILDKEGLLIRLNTKTGVPRGARQSKSAPTPAPVPPLFDPSVLIMNWTRPRRMGSGLYNIGNTCFMNSVLQCLTYTPPLANYIFSKDHANICKLNGFCAMCQFKKHYLQSQQYGSCPIRPNAIVQFLSKIAPSFHLGRQEDSHEFLRYIIDAMQNSCLASASNRFLQEQKYTTVIHQIFGGQMRSQVTCSNCRTRSDTFEPMLDLSLNIKNCGSLLDALKRATQPDTLDGSNSYFCEKCKKKGPALKIQSIHSPPRILTIHLKRFSFGSQLGIKLQTRVSFPSSLNLRQYMTDKQGPPIQYSLYAVLIHAGLTCSSGHYYCYVIGPNSSWYKMNDTYVGTIGLSMVLNSEAYMLFYKQEIPPPTKPSLTNALIIEGLGSSQPSPLARNTQQKIPFNYKDNISLPSNTCPLSANFTPHPVTPSNKTPVTPNKISFFQCLSGVAASTDTLKLLREKNLNNVSSSSKNRTDVAPELPTNYTEENLAPKELNNRTPNNENLESTNQTPASASIATALSQKNETINSFKAGTSKPVAVVTPKQPDTPRTQSTISSTAVHNSSSFKSPSNQLKGTFHPPTFYRSKRKQDQSPGLDTDTLCDIVTQARKGKPSFQSQLALSATEDTELELTPNKKRKIDRGELSPSKQRVNTVSPITMNTNKERQSNPLQIEIVKSAHKSDSSNAAKEKPQINKSFAITGVKGVKPTGIITPLDNTNRENKPEQSPAVESLEDTSITPETAVNRMESEECRSQSNKRNKHRFLKKLYHSSGESKERYMNRALKKGVFASTEELEREFSRYVDNKKNLKNKKVRKKTKKKRTPSEAGDCSNGLGVFDVTSSPDTKSPKSTPTTKVLNRNPHRTKSPPHSTSKNRKTDNRHTRHLSHKDTAESIQLSLEKSENVKSWKKGQESVLNFMKCEEKQEFSDTELDLELDKGRSRKRRRHVSSKKSLSSQFQAEYDRTNS